MKRFRQNQMLLAVVVLAAAALMSCRKNAEEIMALLSETESVEIVESAVADRSGGATLPTVDATQLVESYLQTCGVPGDTTLQRSKTTGAVTYSRTFDLGWIINCNNLNVPQSATVTLGGNGSFGTAHWSGTDTATGSLTLTGLNPQATAYVANGSYTLDGNVTGSLRKSDPSLDVTTTITLVDLNIRKSDRQITGGTGTATIVTTNGKGTSQTVNAALVFNGDGTVTVTVNGHTHSFPLK